MYTRTLKHMFRDASIAFFSAVGVAWWYRRLFKKRGLLTRVVVFHDVPDAVWFELMIRTLVQHFHVMTPEAFRNRLHEHTGINILVTFDDGYASWVEVALPILAKYNVRALFFVNSGLVEATHDETLSTSFMRDRLKITSRRALSRSGLQSLSDAGHSIGGHARTHANLAQLGGNALTSEIEGDKALLERWLGKSIADFAYPFGTPVHVNDIVIQAVQDAGYTQGYTAISHFVPPEETFSIPRMCIEDALTPRELRRWVQGGYDLFDKIKELCVR